MATKFKEDEVPLGEEIPLQTPVWGSAITYTWAKPLIDKNNVLESIKFDTGTKSERKKTRQWQMESLKDFIDMWERQSE